MDQLSLPYDRAAANSGAISNTSNPVVAANYRRFAAYTLAWVFLQGKMPQTLQETLGRLIMSRDNGVYDTDVERALKYIVSSVAANNFGNYTGAKGSINANTYYAVVEEMKRRGLCVDDSNIKKGAIPQIDVKTLIYRMLPPVGWSGYNPQSVMNLLSNDAKCKSGYNGQTIPPTCGKVYATPVSCNPSTGYALPTTTQPAPTPAPALTGMGAYTQPVVAAFAQPYNAAVASIGETVANAISTDPATQATVKQGVKWFVPLTVGLLFVLIVIFSWNYFAEKN